MVFVCVCVGGCVFEFLIWEKENVKSFIRLEMKWKRNSEWDAQPILKLATGNKSVNWHNLAMHTQNEK